MIIGSNNCLVTKKDEFFGFEPYKLLSHDIYSNDYFSFN